MKTTPVILMGIIRVITLENLMVLRKLGTMTAMPQESVKATKVLLMMFAVTMMMRASITVCQKKIQVPYTVSYCIVR